MLHKLEIELGLGSVSEKFGIVKKLTLSKNDGTQILKIRASLILSCTS